MGNKSSYADPDRLLLGSGDLFINGDYVGALTGPVTFNPNVAYAFQRPGNQMADLKSTRITEEVTMDAAVCDFKLSQLRHALGYSQALESGVAANIRARDQLTLPTSAVVTMSEAAVSFASRQVWKMDRSVKYVSGTDYSGPLTGIARKGSTIAVGQTVLCEYDFSDSGAKSLRAGGERTAPPEFLLEFVHTKSGGKRVQVSFFRAVAITDLTMAFDDLAKGTYTMHNVKFKALVDLTKADGKNLWMITEEDGNINI